MTQVLPSHSQLARLAAGMGMLTVGQALIAQGPAFVLAQRPLDWAHWSLLLGALTLTWRLTDIPVRSRGRVGRLAVVAGGAAFVGMSVIDFINWTLPSEAARETFARQVLQAPAISLPFLTVGPSLLFVGLGVLVLEWVRFLPWQVALIVAGIGLVGIGQFGHARWLVVVGHLGILAGLGATWRRVRSNGGR